MHLVNLIKNQFLYKNMKSPDRQYQYDKAYMEMAIAISKLSYAERKKVGAIIVSKDDQVISQGFNGTPAGFDNTCEYYDPKLKRLVTRVEVLHAESNAISKCAKFHSSTDGGTIYITLSPCIDCAKLIIQSGISKVYFLEVYRSLEGIEFLQKCGIQVIQLKMDGDISKAYNTNFKLEDQ